MRRIKNLENATGPQVMRQQRLAEMQTELDGLLRRRDELAAWTSEHVAAPDWEARLRELHLIMARSINMRKRIVHVRNGDPELGHYVGASTPSSHKNQSKPQR